MRGWPTPTRSEWSPAQRFPLQLPLFDLLVVCCSCSRLKITKGRWTKYAVRPGDYPDTPFSHGLCPPCIKRLYADLAALRSAERRRSS